MAHQLKDHSNVDQPHAENYLTGISSGQEMLMAQHLSIQIK
jgi:hypothetical protein